MVRRIRPARDILDCASGVSKSRFTRILAQMQSYPIGQAIAEPLLEGCESWGRSVIRDEIPRWRGAAIPALIFSGIWDGRTPPRNAFALAKDLESSTVVVVRCLAHEFCRTDACRKLVTDYVEGRQPSKGRIIYLDRTGDKLQHVDE